MKRKFYILVLISALFSCTEHKSPSPAIANPKATVEAENLLSFLQEISGTYTLSGQHNYISTGSKYTGLFKELTGKTPVIWGSDFSFCYEGDSPGRFQHCGPLNLSDPSDSVYFTGLDVEEARTKMIDEAIMMHEKGHIITLMWHGCFPTEGDCCDGNNIWAMENRPDAETWKEMVTDGTELNNAWKEQADGIVKHLKRLQDEGVPVLWRPYHEMNGVWFWWCNHPGDDGFKKLWIMMFDYFTNHNKLNNLIWVWNTNAPRNIPGDEAFDYELFYPGGEYVDILAADVYHNDYKQSHHDDIVKLAEGRPVSMGEVGQMPSAEILDNQPFWSWFMPWGNLAIKWNDEELIKNLYNSPRVISLEDLEISKDGKFSIVEKINRN